MRTVGLLLALFLFSSRANTSTYESGSYTPSNYDWVKHAEAMVIATPTLPTNRDARVEAVFIVNERVFGPPVPKQYPYQDSFGSAEWDYTYGEPMILLLRRYPLTGEHWWPRGLVNFGFGKKYVMGLPAWRAIAERYRAISQLNDADAELEAIKSLLAEQQQPDLRIPGFAEDIEHYLAFPNNDKPIAENIRLFHESPFDHVRYLVPWMFAYNKVREVRPFFDGLVASGQWTEHESATVSYFAALGDRRYVDQFIDRIGAPDSTLDQMGARALTQLLVHADLPQILPGLPGLATRAHRGPLRPIGGWLLQQADPKIVPHVKAVVGKNYTKHRYNSLPHALAAAGDTEILEWAQVFLADPYRPYDAPSLPEQIVACSPLPQADELLQYYLVSRHEQHQTQLSAFVEAYSRYYPCPINWERLALLSKTDLRYDTRDTLARLVLKQLRENPQTEAVLYDWFGPPAWLLLAIVKASQNSHAAS